MHTTILKLQQSGLKGSQGLRSLKDCVKYVYHLQLLSEKATDRERERQRGFLLTDAVSKCPQMTSQSWAGRIWALESQPGFLS